LEEGVENMNFDHRKARRFSPSVLTLALVLAFFVLSGSASAATSTSKAHGVVYSAAHAQYGPAKVLKPTVLGTTVKRKAVHKAVAPKAVATARTGGTLPFTGLSLVKLVLVALGLLVIGVILRQSQRSHER
jgi:hypothetical protein